MKRLFDDMGFKEENFTFHKRPGKLNFAVIGVLTVDGTNFDDMVLAQGHKGFTNNWWFGGKNCKALKKTNAVNCTDTDKKTTWCFFRGHVKKYFGDTYVNNTAHFEVRVMEKKC